MSRYIGLNGTTPHGLPGAGVGDLLAAGLYVEFIHIPTGHLVRLPAAISFFDDSFTTNVNSESMYGRMDDIAVYKNTIREITARLQITPVDEEDAMELLTATGMLQKFLYPMYGPSDSNSAKAVTSVSNISSPPLIRTKLANLISHPTEDIGLLGFIAKFSLNPSAEAGYFMGTMGTGIEMFPKQYELDFNFKVLHEHDLGWNKDGNFRGDNSFPHRMVVDTITPTAKAKPQNKKKKDKEAAVEKAQEAKTGMSSGGGGGRGPMPYDGSAGSNV